MDATLARLAELHGIEAGFEDAWGEWHDARDESVRAALRALGVESADDAALREAIERHGREAGSRIVPAIAVLRVSQLPSGVPVRIPARFAGRTLAWRLAEEGGELRHGEFAGGTAIALPPDLTEGYHRLALFDGDIRIGAGTVAVVPERCYLPPPLAAGARLWGVTLQLYGLRSGRNGGIGDFTDLAAAAAAWGRLGASFVGTNPLHAASLRDPSHASPYSPSSRLFLNVLYIDPEATPDFAQHAASDPGRIARWHSRSASLREGDEVDYAGAAAAKRELLEWLHARFRETHLERGTPLARAFIQFCVARGDALRRHAVHEALADVHGRAWREWPAPLRDPGGEAARQFAESNPERVALHEYFQWLAELQLAEAQDRAREAGMSIGLYADLAISVGSDGSEAWANQSLYALGASIGAPPDEFSREGQDWGLPPLAPLRLKQAAYAPFIAMLRANMAHAGALRIDHVMGLSRLWWVPAGMKAADGVYVRYPLEDLLGLLALESQRHRCMVIGEDLGTVSPELRSRLADAHVLSCRLMLFEREAGRFKAPSAYPREALVAWSTHDLPTFAGWWQEADLRLRASLGRIDEAGFAKALEARAIDRRALVEALAREALVEAGTARDGPATRALLEAVHDWLARTPSSLLAVQLEDVFGEAGQANLPGTVDEHPNWRRKLAAPLETWRHDARIARLARRLSNSRAPRGRRAEVGGGPAGAAIPRATYRLQLHAGFGFRDATRILPYLAALGVSHVYCSPYLRARTASPHGYDIIDHGSLNPEIGTRGDYDAFVEALRRHGLAQMADVVPNHMGVLAADNAWWQDVLEEGADSPHADFFDIDWGAPGERARRRVLLPILGSHYGLELAAGRLALRFEAEAGAFAVHYHEHRLPIDPRHYPRILAEAVVWLEAGRAGDAGALREAAEAFARLPGPGEKPGGERGADKRAAKAALARLAATNGAVREAIERSVRAFNGHSADPASFEALHDLLERQAFRVAYWRVAHDEINYRRFFDVNDLAALRQENPAVFEATHRFVLSLVKEGSVDALRIDHPDGLYDPREYFERLQQQCGRPIYVAVEKILAPFEDLRPDWAVHGTTGYRFANVVNALFVDPASEARLTRTYQAFAGERLDFRDVARRCKRLILRTTLASELAVLSGRLARIARSDRNTRDYTFAALRHALEEVIAAFPVYRTYVSDRAEPEDRRYIEWAVRLARSESRAEDPSVYDFVRDALAGELPARSAASAAQLRDFVRRFQQLSAPVMAKGVEDTAFYVYNRLASLNDVGGDPEEFGIPVGRFHKASANRQRHWPHTMLATSTHDNKRSEDVRLRIDVISERVAEWRLQLHRWQRMNRERKAVVDGRPAPSANDEYLLYQTLLGSHPPGRSPPGEREGYADRIVAYMRKAMREAKRHTSWANPNVDYEEATTRFVRALLEERPGNAFLEDLRAAVEAIAWIGFLNGLSMVTIKLTSPGVPDLYQGNELWDLSLVDPDNRRPVDYGRRQALLQSLSQLRDPVEPALAEILTSMEDGRAKLYATWRLLQLRKDNEALFRDGGYSALKVTGASSRHVVAYARRHRGSIAVVVAPRLLASLGLEERSLPCGERIWGDTRVHLPFLASGTVLRNAFTHRDHPVEEGGLPLGRLLEGFPTAVLAHRATVAPAATVSGRR